MKRCIAFVAEGRSDRAWRPCRKMARKNCVFCGQHEKVVTGVMLGICVHDFPDGVRVRRKPSLSEMPVASRVPS